MGCDLSFIAFNNQPNAAFARSIRTCRLLKRKVRAEWYLDGPSKNRQDLILFERPTVDHRALGPKWTNALKEYGALADETKRQGRGTFGLDYNIIPIALALSDLLHARLLVVSGNDEDLDCGFICENGRLIRGRFLVGEAEAGVFDVEGGLRIDKLEWSEGHRLYELASAVAADYFKAPDAELYAAEWEERSDSAYEVVAAAAAIPERRSNLLVACVALGLGFLALLIIFSEFPAAILPLGAVLVAVVLVWRYWPSR